MGDARREDPRSHMLQHLRNEHPELIDGEVSTHKHFRMKILRQHNKPLGRLLHEALRIGNEIARGKKILNNLEEYSRCFIPTLDTVRNPLNPNSRPARTQRGQNLGDTEGTLATEDPKNPTEKNTLPGTELDLDEYDEVLKMKRKMIDDMDEDECKHGKDRNTQTNTHRRKRMRYTEQQPRQDSVQVEETNTHTNTQSRRSPGLSLRSTESTKIKIQASKDTHIRKDIHTHRGTKHTSKHNKGTTKHDRSSISNNPLRSNNSRNLKTSKRGAKDVYVGENITKYFSILRSGGANRNKTKGKIGISSGSQEGDGDEVNGNHQVYGQDGNPSQLILNLTSTNTN